MRCPCLEWSNDADNQASGRAYCNGGAGSSLIIGQPGIWSAGSSLIIVVRARLHSSA